MLIIKIVYIVFIVFILVDFQYILSHSILPPIAAESYVEIKPESSNDEFYKIKNEFYNQESKQIYLYCDANGIDDLDFSIRMLKKEAKDNGFNEIKVVYDISKVPIHSTLLLFISPPSRSSVSYYHKLKSIMGYEYQYKDDEDVKDLKIYSRVYIFGKTYEFSKFHNDLDIYLTTQRQYRIVKHPFRSLEKSHLSLFVKLASLNQNTNISKALMKYEKLQFPLNRFNIDVYGLPSDEQCKNERSLIVELKSWGMISCFHILSFQLLLGVYADRMTILMNQDFQYGQINHLFLPASICDHYDNYDRNNLKYFNSTIDPKLDYKNKVLLNPGHLHYSSHHDNFVPKEFTQQFSSTFAVNTFLLSYLTSPTYQLREHINKQILNTFKLTYGMPKRCISIHVRHGDKNKEAKIFRFQQYYDVIRSLNTTIRDVFIMTDDEKVIRDADHLSKDEDLFDFYYLNLNRTDSDNNEKEKIAHQYFDPNDPREKYGYDMVTETTIASKCEIVCCTMSSNVCRYIVELQAIEEKFKNIEIKYISLDIAYYQDLSRVH